MRPEPGTQEIEIYQVSEIRRNGEEGHRVPNEVLDATFGSLLEEPLGQGNSMREHRG